MTNISTNNIINTFFFQIFYAEQYQLQFFGNSFPTFFCQDTFTYIQSEGSPFCISTSPSSIVLLARAKQDDKLIVIKLPRSGGEYIYYFNH